MKLNDWDMFRLEDRVLFEAAAAAELDDAVLDVYRQDNES